MNKLSRAMYPQPANLDPTISVIVADGSSTQPSNIAITLGDHPDIDVVVCNSGTAAHALIQQFVPDIAVLDVGMSDLNVSDVLSSIAASSLKTKVVCLTASSLGYDLAGAMAMGVQGILVRGGAPGDIVDCVRDVFQG